MTGTNEPQLVPIPAFDFKGHETLPFDLYIRLPLSNRVILYRRRGTQLDPQTADSAVHQRKDFFIPPEQYKNYLSLAAQEIVGALDPESLDPQAAQKISNQILSNLFSQAQASEAKILIERTGELVMEIISQFKMEEFAERRKVFEMFAGLAKKGNENQKHPLHITSLTLMFAMGLGLVDRKTLLEVGLASLLHDVGLTRLPAHVVQEGHNEDSCGPVVYALLKEHPQMSLDWIQTHKIQLSQLMSKIILQHHEQYNGKGYPAYLQGDEIHPMAQVLMVSEHLEKTLMVSHPKGFKISVSETLRRLETKRTVQPALIEKIRALIVEVPA